MLSRSLVFIASLTLATLCDAGEVVVLRSVAGTTTLSPMLTIAEGETAKLVGVSFRGTAVAPARLVVTTKEGANGNISLLNAIDTHGFTIPGPGTIQYDRGGNVDLGAGFVTIEVTRAPELTAAIPAASVMIPEDADGQFQVLLESTTDGVVWELAQPGTYGGSTVKRFFRTRILKVQ